MAFISSKTFAAVALLALLAMHSANGAPLELGLSLFMRKHFDSEWVTSRWRKR